MVMAIVMGLIIVSFVIWGVGDMFRGFSSDKVASVGGESVTAQQSKRHALHARRDDGGIARQHGGADEFGREDALDFLDDLLRVLDMRIGHGENDADERTGVLVSVCNWFRKSTVSMSERSASGSHCWGTRTCVQLRRMPSVGPCRPEGVSRMTIW